MIIRNSEQRLPADLLDKITALAQGCHTASRSADLHPQTAEQRVFSTWEITQYMIPVAPAHLRRVLRTHPELPQGQSKEDGPARWFTLDEINILRKFLAKAGAASKSYLPYRPDGRRAQIITLANSCQGSGKTTVAAHLAVAAVLDGYKVLAIDLDGQGALSTLLSDPGQDQGPGILPILARDAARHLLEDNKRRAANAQTPLPLEGAFREALDTRMQDLIKGSRWPGLDIVPAALPLQAAELLLPEWRRTVPGWRPWGALLAGLEADGILEHYDMVVIDTPPVLAALSLTGIVAADILLTPLQGVPDQAAQTGQYLGMIRAQLDSIETEEERFAQALDLDSPRFGWHAVRAVLCSPEDTQVPGQGAAIIQATLGLDLVAPPLDYSPLAVGQTVYDVDYRSYNRETYARARAPFDAFYRAVRGLTHDAWQAGAPEQDS